MAGLSTMRIDWGWTSPYWLLNQSLLILMMITVITIVGDPKPSVILDFPNINPLSLIQYPPTVLPKVLFMVFLIILRALIPR